jgi:hypothetical protein
MCRLTAIWMSSLQAFMTKILLGRRREQSGNIKSRAIHFNIQTGRVAQSLICMFDQRSNQAPLRIHKHLFKNKIREQTQLMQLPVKCNQQLAMSGSHSALPFRPGVLSSLLSYRARTTCHVTYSPDRTLLGPGRLPPAGTTEWGLRLPSGPRSVSRSLRRTGVCDECSKKMITK